MKFPTIIHILNFQYFSNFPRGDFPQGKDESKEGNETKEYHRENTIRNGGLI